MSGVARQLRARLQTNPWSEWKKLLIRSYSFPVLQTLMRKRVPPASLRQTTRSHPCGCNVSRAIRTTSLSSSAGVDVAERDSVSSFTADLAASRILRKRFSYLISNSRPASKVIRSGDIGLLARLSSACAGFHATNESAQVPGDRD